MESIGGFAGFLLCDLDLEFRLNFLFLGELWDSSSKLSSSSSSSSSSLTINEASSESLSSIDLESWEGEGEEFQISSPSSSFIAFVLDLIAFEALEVVG